jgi:hypothetical protein
METRPDIEHRPNPAETDSEEDDDENTPISSADRVQRHLEELQDLAETYSAAGATLDSLREQMRTVRGEAQTLEQKELLRRHSSFANQSMFLNRRFLISAVVVLLLNWRLVSNLVAIFFDW